MMASTTRTQTTMVVSSPIWPESPAIAPRGAAGGVAGSTGEAASVFAIGPVSNALTTDMAATSPPSAAAFNAVGSNVSEIAPANQVDTNPNRNEVITRSLAS